MAKRIVMTSAVANAISQGNPDCIESSIYLFLLDVIQKHSITIDKDSLSLGVNPVLSEPLLKREQHAVMSHPLLQDWDNFSQHIRDKVLFFSQDTYKGTYYQIAKDYANEIGADENRFFHAVDRFGYPLCGAMVTLRKIIFTETSTEEPTFVISMWDIPKKGILNALTIDFKSGMFVSDLEICHDHIHFDAHYADVSDTVMEDFFLMIPAYHDIMQFAQSGGRYVNPNGMFYSEGPDRFINGSSLPILYY